jgi:hypothetical protein
VTKGGGWGSVAEDRDQWRSRGTSEVGVGPMVEPCGHSNNFSRYKDFGKYLDQLFEYMFSGMTQLVCC